MKLKIFALLFIAFFALSCNNTIELNAPYKEIAVVYGFIDENAPYQAIRIQKAFQTSGNVTIADAANNPDSIYFDTLIVTLKNLTTGINYPCVRIDTIPKDSGFFGSTKNVVYLTVIPKNANLINEVYELEIINPVSGNTYRSRANIVKNAIIEGRNIFLSTAPNAFLPFRFTQGANAVIHDCSIKLNYTEHEANDTSIKTNKFVEYFLVKNQEINRQGQMVDLRVRTVELIAFWKNYIKPDNTKKRYVTSIEYVVYAGGNDFKVLLDLAKPNTSIVQKKPEFSNIENGLGIFTSRNLVIAGPPQITLGSSTIDIIVQELPNFYK
ncbi:MAG: hypothetical protein ACK4K9_09075 [Bacteroidia bacterium]